MEFSKVAANPTAAAQRFADHFRTKRGGAGFKRDFKTILEVIKTSGINPRTMQFQIAYEAGDAPTCLFQVFYNLESEKQAEELRKQLEDAVDNLSENMEVIAEPGDEGYKDTSWELIIDADAVDVGSYVEYYGDDDEY